MEEIYMKRALELAEKGTGYTNPNPLVGAVIVKEGRIIGEGYHEFYGGPHAEINALKRCREDINGSDIYVTLEPCSHYGKTPPCTDALLKSGIKRVIIAMKDPNPIVSGTGINMLRAAGIEVIIGVLKEESSKLNEVFIKYITKKIPFCIMKNAITLDGKIATHTGDSKWITNESSRDYVHKLRHKTSSIMVGINTVIKDNPELTTRLKEHSGNNPIRIIIDSEARIPLESKVLKINSSGRTIIAVTEKAERQKLLKLKEIGAEIIETPRKEHRVDLKFLMKELGKRNIDSVLLEGGGTLNFSALKEGIVDKILCFIAPKVIGGKNSLTSVEGEGFGYIKEAILLSKPNVFTFEEDILLEYYIKNN